MIDTTVFMPFYFEWDDTLAYLSDEDYGKLLRAVMVFARTGEKCSGVSELSPMVQMAYQFITSCISRSEKKRRAGQKGGLARAKAAKEAQAREAQAREENVENREEILTKTTDKQEIIANNGKTQEINTKKSTPSLDEVRSFFKSREFKSNPDEFYNFYESNGWLVGRNPMKNWCSSAENWEIKASRPTECIKNSDTLQQNPHFDEKRSYDVHEAFRLALERSYGPNADLDEE